MPQVKRPRRGSLAFYPRKRAKRTYPALSTYPSSDKPSILAFAGYKAGMTHAMLMDNNKGSPTFGSEIAIPVTILDCPPLKVVGVRAYKSTPKGMLILTDVWAKNVNKELPIKTKASDEKQANFEKQLAKAVDIRLIISTQPLQSGLKKKTAEVFELEIGGKDVNAKWNYAKQILGQDIPVTSTFKDGDYVDAIAVTKGKGTAGTVKKFHIRIQNRHAKQKRRHVGAIAAQVPRRVLWTAPMAGQMGLQTRTELNKRILKILDGSQVTPSAGFKRYGVVKGTSVVVQGSVPGPKKRLIFLRMPIRPIKPKAMPEVREIIKGG
ncbi:50S ribosomal protein L3 [archaeon]|nr:MAG: 50S ribosomal protein L3 [archaeon]